MKKIFIICFCFVGLGLSAQNLTGVSFDATMGVLDPASPCMVDAGTHPAVDRWAATNTSCPGDAGCFVFTDNPQYNTFDFKNIVNLAACIEVNIVTGSCGAQTGLWAVEGAFIVPGAPNDVCNNTILGSTGAGGTTTVSFEVDGCTPFALNFHNGFGSVQCTYSFSISPDPLVDLRCAADDVACIEKVKIGGTPVPTMTQWGFFLFGLIILTLGVVTLYNMTSAQINEQV